MKKPKYTLEKESVCECYLDNDGYTHTEDCPIHKENECDNKNEKVLRSLIKFCNANPEYRFWQSVYAWLGLSGIGGIWIDGLDPFHWKGKLK